MPTNSVNPCVIVHGGAGRLSVERAKLKLPKMKEAVQAAWREVSCGKPAEFGVAAALRVLEHYDCFNAGYGGYPNANGIVLLDLGFMRGNRDFVSLLNVRRIKYPSAIALDMFEPNRTIMTVWTHELMQEIEKANTIVKDRYGFVESHEELLSPQVKQWLSEEGGEFGKSGETTSPSSDTGLKEKIVKLEEPGTGTVGCVVRDLKGNLAAGTSTGGVNAKENGRIGDSPIIGSGVFADDEICALSTTGHGESLLLGLVSGFVIGRMRELVRVDPKVFKKSPSKLQTILNDEFQELARKRGKRGGGMIVVPPFGPPAFSFNSEMISVAIGIQGPDGGLKVDSRVACQDGMVIR